ncbi:branched-chain amino acid ABC transporter permease [Pseudooceanicola atlanticus]|uniref:branched-chain amino acid ABC transporter permease n=1 Tax=Pseudooceanicola atlanticus TaxID=1461694 RepID=UPI00235461D2|nr:branched-chain amino acid ABC transporter permease [Pseudooceanicola atlanticus]
MTRTILLYIAMVGLLLAVGLFQSWSVAVVTLNLCLISAVMALGVNIQWGYAGLFNAGITGFAAVGGVVAMIVSHPPVVEAVALGGTGVALAFLVLISSVVGAVFIESRLKGRSRTFLLTAVLAFGFLVFSAILRPAAEAVEGYDAAATGFLGGFGLPILLSWPLAGLAAGGVAFLIGKVALGLRSDYLAIATLGIAEIIVSIIKNEDWLTRGVKNASGLPRPIIGERAIQTKQWFIDLVAWYNQGALDILSEHERTATLTSLVAEASSLAVKLSFTGLFSFVLISVLVLSALALNSPWGRMVRAIRDNEVAASAMGKNVGWRHLQILMLGSGVVGLAGAMLVTLDGQLTPTAYVPLRFTFLVWLMVIVGGAGSNVGSVFGAFLIWFLWVQSEPVGYWLAHMITQGMADTSPLRAQIIEQAQHFRLLAMGILLLVILRFNPHGLIPERPIEGLTTSNMKKGN